jgi:predicted metal-dependent HD superfamily phosphohydrolase
MLKEIFIELASTYSKDESLIISLWNEIEKKYNSRKRHYHTLTHLEKLIEQLQACKTGIADWHTVLFSVFYHDIVYNALKGDNEEKSAELAVKRLAQVDFPEDKIDTCKEMILATKAHTISPNADTNLFTDADLSILGQPPETYKQYCLKIRKEYSTYPDIVYKPGRKKVLAHFLAMDRIYKTGTFFGKDEKQARENLQRELSQL